MNGSNRAFAKLKSTRQKIKNCFRGDIISESKYKKQTEWNRKHTKHYGFKFNCNTDKDIIKQLEKQQSKQTYIKTLIRADITKEK